jgi:ribosomal protein S18 acetylase RimI-like enzyme
MIIRVAKKDDLEKLVPLFVEYNQSLWKLLPKKDSFFKNPKNNFPVYIKKSVSYLLSHKKYYILVAEESGKLVGTVSGWVEKERNSLFKDSCILGNLGYFVVKKEFAGRGIGSRLKRELFLYFKNKKVNFITLEVNLNNPAKEIYKKWGFKTYSEKMSLQF